MNTKQVGEVSEAQVLGALLLSGEIVLQPFGDNQRYDLVVDRDGEFVRIQCKTGRLADGVVSFAACSSSVHRGGTKRDYRTDADFFGVYCPETKMCYLVPVGEVGRTEGTLRIDPPKNHQQRKVRWAKDYEIQE